MPLPGAPPRAGVWGLRRVRPRPPVILFAVTGAMAAFRSARLGVSWPTRPLPQAVLSGGLYSTACGSGRVGSGQGGLPPMLQYTDSAVVYCRMGGSHARRWQRHMARMGDPPATAGGTVRRSLQYRLR